ncbi:MAG TPA: hypothetical protein VM573_05400 [Actinomycetota bacterium]|jgi:Fe-S cluster assembly iron-binding protein IscA|nr:hypothetical protein [Actinomycetota bacterium]
MALEVTEEAAEVLARSLEMAGIRGGGVRLRAARGLGGGDVVQVELADGPGPGEHVVEAGRLRIFVDSEVASMWPDAVLALEPQHDTVVLRPAGADT